MHSTNWFSGLHVSDFTNNATFSAWFRGEFTSQLATAGGVPTSLVEIIAISDGGSRGAQVYSVITFNMAVKSVSDLDALAAKLQDDRNPYGVFTLPQFATYGRIRGAGCVLRHDLLQ